MAYADYRLCDVCQEKAFYDANLNYELGGSPAYRVNGEDQDCPINLYRLGDWAVLCTECAKTHRTQIVPRLA